MPLGNACFLRLAAQDCHGDAWKNSCIGPDDRRAVPEGEVPDRRFANPSFGVDEGGIIESLADRLPQKESLGGFADRLDGRERSLVIDGHQPERTGRPVGRRCGANQDRGIAIGARRRELPVQGKHGGRQRLVSRPSLDR